MSDLTRLFLPPSRGAGTQLLMSGTCTVWTGGAGPLYPSTVIVGTATYTNLPVINPAAMGTGLVLLISTPAGPIILGKLYAGA